MIALIIPTALAALFLLGFFLNLWDAPVRLVKGLVPRTGTDPDESNAGLFNLMLTPTLTPFAPSTPAATMTPSPTACQLPDGWMTYLVNPTDSLLRLSIVYGSSIEELQRANCMGDSTALLPGQVIFVPFVPTSTPTQTLMPSPVPTQVPTNTAAPVYNPPPPTNTPEPVEEPTNPPPPPPPTNTPVPVEPPTDVPVPPTTAPTSIPPTEAPIPTSVPPTAEPTLIPPTAAPTIPAPTPVPVEPATPTVAP